MHPFIQAPITHPLQTKPQYTNRLAILLAAILFTLTLLSTHPACAQNNTPTPATDTPAQQTPAQTKEPATTNNEQTHNTDNWDTRSEDNPSFDITVQSDNSQITTLLENYLDLYRYRTLSDLTFLELQRLLEHTEDNIRSLTGTLGYFSPEIHITVIPAEQRDPQENRLPLIHIDVASGPVTTIKELQLQFEGAIEEQQNELLISSQRRRLRWGWAMREGDTFSQDGWSTAKSNMVSRLTAQYYPAGKISYSRAAIDPQDNTATLSITLDSGPRFYLGQHNIEGLDRYSERLVRNFSRLRPADNYLLDELQKAQQRLAESGYFDSVFLYVNPEDPNPEAADIHVVVREAYYQKLTIGPGYSTDNGPRLTLEYLHNEIPLLGWQAITALKVDSDNQQIESTLSSIPSDTYWRLIAYAKFEHIERSDEKTTSAQLRFGRSYTSDTMDRSYFVQYDKAKTENANGTENVQAISANTAWVLRRFNNTTTPTRGWGLAIELGAGSTFGTHNTPFIRLKTRAMRFIPMESWRNGRFLLRGEFGGVFAKAGEPIPSTLLFRTGGDSTVRGYAYRYIGVNKDNGVTESGRYMVVGSIEYQRPIFIGNKPTAFDWAIFTDIGAVSDRYQDLNLYTGVGAGIRWRSPVGPLNIDLGYGLKTQQIRLHFNIGFTF